MNERMMIALTVKALKGARMYVQCLTQRDATRSLREYADWLMDMQMPVKAMHSTLIVKFEGGGCVRFASSAHETDGLTPFQVSVDDVLRSGYD